MTRRLGPILLAMGILCATCAWAQNDTGTPDADAPTQPGPKPAYIYPDATPSLNFLSQSLENSSISLGIGTGFSYTDYGYGSSTPSQGRWLFHVTPSIRIQQFRPKLTWHVSYAGGYQTYTNPTGQSNANSSLFAQNAGAGILWQLARRWQLTASDSFSHSANPFDSYLTTVGTPTMNNPNPVTYFSLTQFTQNFGVLALTHQLTNVDKLSFAGTSNLRRTSAYSLLTSVPFYDLTSYGGRVSYSRQLSARLSLGVGYDYNSLDFGKGQQRSGVQTIPVTADYFIRPNITISAWVGPEHTGTKTTVGIPILGQIVTFTTHDSLWSTALGVNFGWRGLRNSFQAGFSRQVMDGGGIIATSQVNMVNASYRRMLTSKMDLVLAARYVHDLSTTVSSRSFDYSGINAALTYKLAKSLHASATYAFVHQTQSNAFLIGSGSSYNDSIVGVSVTYSWNHPLGR